MRKYNNHIMTALALLTMNAAQAEISGSGIRTGDCDGTVGNLVWHDVNGNGIQDADERGLSNVRVHIAPDGEPHIVFTTYTDLNGVYLFEEVCHGQFLVDVDESSLAPGMVPSPTDIPPGHIREVLGNDSQFGSVFVVVNQGAKSDVTIDFGYHRPDCPASVSGQVWLDDSNDGLRQSDEQNIVGVPVNLLGEQGDAFDSTMTDATGHYRFDNLCAGTYQLDVDERDDTLVGLVATQPSDGTQPEIDSDQPTDGQPVQIPLGAAQIIDHMDFGFYAPDAGANIVGRAFMDWNQNGLRDDGDTPIESARVTLFALGGDMMRHALTDRDGYYRFEGLTAGGYSVDLIDSSIPDHWQPAQANQGHDDTVDSDASASAHVSFLLADGDTRLNTDFGFTSECQGSIGDRIWADGDGNGVQESGEPGLGDARVLLRDGNGERIARASTDADGYYGFQGLCAGEYYLQVLRSSLPEGATPSAPASGSEGSDPVLVNLADGSTAVNDVDFGFQTCSLQLAQTCAIIPAADESYHCKKDIESLSMRWDGEQPIRVVAYQGKKNTDPVIVDIDNVQRGDIITVPELKDAGKDTVWEIYAAGTDTLLGESKFHLECKDVLDGAEDCGTPQGAGKNGDCDDCIADWLLEGIVDKDSELVCITATEAASQNCQLDAPGRVLQHYTLTNTGTTSIQDAAVFDDLNGMVTSAPIGTLVPGASVMIELAPWVHGSVENYAGASGVVAGSTCEVADIVQIEVPHVVHDIDCHGQLEQLSLIWDGTETIDVVAHDGKNDHDQVMFQLQNIAIGQEITMTALGDAKKDIMLELFAAGTDYKLGESKFHLSCSDKDMDGMEDCGTRQGDGKDDCSGNDCTNDWLLEGIVDDDESLDCLP